jgi:polyhydroxyalkanoate synthesis regulator phasin
VNDQNGRYARLRNTATGALATLAAVGAIVGTAALAANSHAKPDRQTAVTNGGATKTAMSLVPDKTHTPQPAVNHQPFLNAIQQLVDNGTITPTEGQAVDREILAGRVDTQALASSGFTPTQLQAVEQALSNTKRALGPKVPPTAPGKNSTPQQDANNPFVIAVQRLVNDGMISKTEGQAVDREILAGSIDTQTLTSSGFTPTQLQAVEQTLENTKRAL